MISMLVLQHMEYIKPKYAFRAFMDINEACDIRDQYSDMLRYAIINRNSKMFQFILKSGESVYEGENPYVLAIQYNRLKYFKDMLDHNVSRIHEDNDIVLRTAIKHRANTFIGILLRRFTFPMEHIEQSVIDDLCMSGQYNGKILKSGMNPEVVNIGDKVYTNARHLEDLRLSNGMGGSRIDYALSRSLMCHFNDCEEDIVRALIRENRLIENYEDFKPSKKFMRFVVKEGGDVSVSSRRTTSGLEWDIRSSIILWRNSHRL